MSKTKRHRLKISIKIVTAVYFVTAIILLSTFITVVGYNFYKNSVMQNYEKYVSTVLNYAYAITEDYSFGDMIASRSMPEEYEEMREELNKVKENSEISYLYAVYFDDINDIHSLTYAINTKTEEDLRNGGTYTYLGTPCEEGSFEEDDLLAYQGSVINKDTSISASAGNSAGYGYMFNGRKVIFDSNGEAAGIICVEINVENINRELNHYIRNIAIFGALFTILITVIFVWGAEYHFSHPIARLTDFARDFIKNIGNQDAIDESVRKLKAVAARPGNEIGELYTTVSRLESGMADQYRALTRYSENTIKMQDGLIVLIADMVENRDSDTGEHIQKTAAYVRIIMDGLNRKGYYSEQLTPQYMEYVEKSAPLHDTGKIKIPDSILNKPGKLTPEEFDIMKRHTIFGEEIIEKAIHTVEGESYLTEARNMAAYHHERWDGKGYPEGLKEEDIPLSARIMAVADVFDALASKRVYKNAYTMEESLKIIRDGSGTQFDPKCVEVFLEASGDIASVLEKYRSEN